MRRAVHPLACFCCLAWLFAAAAAGADAPGAAPASDHRARVYKENVRATIDLRREAGDEAVLVGRFAPDANLHIYGIDLPADAEGGVATSISLPADSPIAARGPLTADQKSHLEKGLLIYHPGPVTLELPIRLPHRADGAPVAAKVVLSWMACGPDFCKNPVIKLAVPVSVPSVRRAAATQRPPSGSGAPTSACRRRRAPRSRSTPPSCSARCAPRSPTRS